MRKRWWIAVTLGILVSLVASSSLYLLATSPFSRYSIMEPPFSTTIVGGEVRLHQHYTPKVYSGWLASAVGYYKQGVSIFWNRCCRSPQASSTTADDIIADIHRLRFDPRYPYVISGDQFNVLYLRNLGVFYHELLNHDIALSEADWQNRQRIAVQSEAYGLAALDQLHRPVTTLEPVSRHSLVAANIYHYPSDCMYGLMNMLRQLQQNPGTARVADELLRGHRTGLTAAYRDYLHTVRDPRTGLVRKDVTLSSARDAAQRQSSFYDNVILWRTQQLAGELGIAKADGGRLENLRSTIIREYWDDAEGHFIDDKASGHGHSYSSDWLIGLSTGFLRPDEPSDLEKLKRSSTYIDTHSLADPLPIRYTDHASDQSRPWAVRLFVGTYGSTAIWSYWGSQYIALQAVLHQQTGDEIYAEHARKAINGWRAVMVRDRGFPETLDDKGNILKTFMYESIRQTGWVVDFEYAEQLAGYKPE